MLPAAEEGKGGSAQALNSLPSCCGINGETKCAVRITIVSSVLAGKKKKLYVLTDT